MKILAANLRHLYQKKYSSFYAMLFAMPPAVFMVGMLDDGRGGFVAMSAIAMLSVGMLLGSLSLDVLGRPFSYCLPGHRKVPRQFLFIIGIIACLVEAMIVYTVRRAGFEGPAMTFVSAFFAGSVFYWLGAWLVFRTPMMGVSFAGLPLFIAMGFWFFGGAKFCDNLILNQYFIVIPAGIAAYVLAWQYWGKEDLPRRYCGTVLLMMLGGKMTVQRQAQMNRAFEEKKKDKGKSSSLIKSEVETFFTNKIASSNSASLSAFVWGRLYESFGVLLSRGYIIFLVIILFLVCFLGYIVGEGNGSFMIVFMPIWMLSQACHSKYSKVPMIIGRRERFWAAVSQSAVISAIFIVLLILFVLLAVSLKPIMPSFSIAGYTLTYQSFDPIFIPTVSLMLPIMFVIGVINRKDANRQACVCLPFIAAAVLSFFLFKPFYPSLKVLLLQGVLLILLGWGCFITVLRYTFFRCDLTQ